MQVEPEGIEDGGIRGSYHSFVSLLKTKVWLEEDLLHMPTGMAEAEGGGRTVASALG